MREIDPKRTKRAAAFELWMNSPMPMVTLFKDLEVTNLIRLRKRRGYKFNMLMCWCVGKAASMTEEFYLLPVGDKLMQYDRIAVNAVVATSNGGISACDIPFFDDLEEFNRHYLKLTRQVRESCAEYRLGEDYMVVGTSALTGHDITGAVNQYSGVYNNPFLIWGKYRKRLLKTTLSVSFQFHHTQMDGIPAAEFLDRLQNEIRRLKR